MVFIIRLACAHLTWPINETLIDPATPPQGRPFCLLPHVLDAFVWWDLFVKIKLFPISSYSLLDKLLVVCPNVDYCEEVLPRCELESHLLYRWVRATFYHNYDLCLLVCYFWHACEEGDVFIHFLACLLLVYHTCGSVAPKQFSCSFKFMMHVFEESEWSWLWNKVVHYLRRHLFPFRPCRALSLLCIAKRSASSQWLNTMRSWKRAE